MRSTAQMLAPEMHVGLAGQSAETILSQPSLSSGWFQSPDLVP